MSDIERELGQSKVNLSSYTDILIKKGEIYRDRINEAKRVKSDREMQECTFKPKVINEFKSSFSNDNGEIGAN